MKKSITVAVLIASLFTPLVGQAAPLTPEQERERQRQQQQRPPQRPSQQQQPQVQRPPQRPPQQQPQVQRPPQRPPQQQPQVQRPTQRPQQQQPQVQRPTQRPPQQHGVSRPDGRHEVHRPYQPPRRDERLKHRPPTRFRPAPIHRPPHYRPWDHRHVHYRHNYIRRYWIDWRIANPTLIPSVFTLFVDSRPYNLEYVRPGTWYYRSESVNFVVPKGYVVISQDEVWYPGDTVESEEFAFFTEEAFQAFNEEQVPEQD